MWNVQPIFFDDENEDELKARYIELRALHPDEEPGNIAAYVFKYLKDPQLRALQAAASWEQDLEVRERIRYAKANGGKEPEEWTKEKVVACIAATILDSTLSHHEKKVRNEGYMQIAALNGWVIKAIDKTIDNKRSPQIRPIVYAQYEDDE